MENICIVLWLTRRPPCLGAQGLVSSDGHTSRTSSFFVQSLHAPLLHRNHVWRRKLTFNPCNYVDILEWLWHINVSASNMTKYREHWTKIGRQRVIRAATLEYVVSAAPERELKDNFPLQKCNMTIRITGITFIPVFREKNASNPFNVLL